MSSSVNKCYVPKLRFRGFEGEYKEIKISDVSEFYKGDGYSKKDIIDNGKYEVILYGDLFTTYKNNIEEIKYKTNRIGNKKTRNNSILFPGSSTSLNDFFPCCSIKKEVFVGSDLNIFELNINEDSLYYSYCFSKPYHLKNIFRLTEGSTINHLYGKYIAEYKLIVPVQLIEQKEISSFFNLLDKQISLLENKLKLTELKMKDFIKKSNVESSKLMIKDIAIVIDGFPFKQTSYVKNGIPIYTISNIGDNKFIDAIEYKYTNIEIDSKYQLNKGDIFASLTGEKGFKSLLYQNENKNYINQRTIKIEIKNNYSPELLQFWCFKNKRKISLLATGSQKNISKKDVENFLVPKCTKENINLSKIFFNYIENVQLIQNKLHMLNKRKTFFLKNLFI